MADDKNIKAPDIPAADTGPGTGQPQASKAGPEKQEPKAAPLPDADKKLEPEAASPNVSVYKKGGGTGGSYPGKIQPGTIRERNG